MRCVRLQSGGGAEDGELSLEGKAALQQLERVELSLHVISSDEHGRKESYELVTTSYAEEPNSLYSRNSDTIPPTTSSWIRPCPCPVCTERTNRVEVDASEVPN